MRLLAVLLLHLSSSSEALQVRMSKRARSRARGKRQEGPQPQQLKQGIASVEVVRQNYARIHYHNGSSAEVHSPSLAQTQHGEWLAVRAALDITASEFAAARDAWKHATREELLRRKMGQGPKFTGNAATRFGLEMEPHAIALYERLTDSTVTPTGLHMHPNLRWGASPDGIVTTPQGETGLLEVKCFFRCRGSGEVPQVDECPPGFYDQIQGQLEIMEMAWCDLILFTPARKGAAPGRNSCVLRVPRNECAYGPRLEPWTNPGAVPA
eukprot:Transcript_3196.p1 GENE.Transcript_3196~~Transcript_3196.p1  ORF type:complete len:268 (+),score=97.27 Transcript_3196:92-895(+)